MAHFIFSAFCDESGENSIEGQIKACKSNGITHMELRGFGKGKKRSWYSGKPFTKGDFLAIGLSVMLLVISVLLTVLNGNRFFNPFA